MTSSFKLSHKTNQFDQSRFCQAPPPPNHHLLSRLHPHQLHRLGQTPNKIPSTYCRDPYLTLTDPRPRNKPHHGSILLVALLLLSHYVCSFPVRKPVEPVQKITLTIYFPLKSGNIFQVAALGIIPKNIAARKQEEQIYYQNVAVDFLLKHVKPL